MTKSNPTRAPANDDIDLDRVVMDPAYRRRIVARLSAEAATNPSPPGEPRERATPDD